MNLSVARVPTGSGSSANRKAPPSLMSYDNKERSCLLSHKTATSARKRCAREVGSCQAPVVAYAAAKLAADVERCGSLDKALRAYNSGGCGPGGRYARRINGELAHLVELAPAECPEVGRG